ncbi:MAG: oxidoreductase [Bacteroidota bacterium]
MSHKTALVLGASGLIGSLLTELLLQSPEYSQVTLLLRRKIHLSHPKLHQEVINFDQPDPSKIKGNDLFCCLGTTIKVAGSKEAFYKVDCTYPYNIGQLALQSGTSQYLLVTAMGADSASSIFYNRVKGEIEQKITSLHFPTFCIFRPSLLMGDRQEFRMGEKIAQGFSKIFAGLMFGPLKKYKPIEARKVAAAMLLLANQGLTGKHVFESDALQKY